jgi:hypothetical protein
MTEPRAGLGCSILMRGRGIHPRSRRPAFFTSDFNLISPVQPSTQKYSASVFQKFMFLSAHPVSSEGRLAIVTDVGAGCGGREGVERA